MSQKVDVRHRSLKLNTSEEVRELFKDVELSEVEELWMSGTSISAAAGKEIGTFIKRMPSLRVAHLADIFVTRSIDEVPIAITGICEGLLECKELLELDLSNNAFGSRVAPLLVPLLSKNTSIQVLKINNNGFGPEGGSHVAGALVEAAKLCKTLGQPPSLRVFICGRNRLEDGSASVWGKVFEANTNLQKVKMVNNGFFEPGITALANGLKHCPDLRHLSFRDSTAHNEDTPEEVHGGRRGWHNIADVVRVARDLEFLDLSDCYLTEDGSTELIAALSENPHPKLDTILLENNDLGSAHYESLKEILPTQLAGLKVLDLALNEDLEDNETITELTELLESRGGRLITDDEECDADDLQKNAMDAEKETRFVQTLQPPVVKAEPKDEDIDELAKLVSGGLKIENA
ncbi:hypothetical protein CPB83DRAFT_861524 [Crepidotus variabilis]|uniref:RNI-like protein n=1 Tax=Crepidotus variabilis TaxID=179855 RepID=A0A9P6E8H0_9AGAR|nr:hypothetical protein CPB83DRAFT_861524 [Crepidotus variabilis]